MSFNPENVKANSQFLKSVSLLTGGLFQVTFCKILRQTNILTPHWPKRENVFHAKTLLTVQWFVLTQCIKPVKFSAWQPERTLSSHIRSPIRLDLHQKVFWGRPPKTNPCNSFPPHQWKQDVFPPNGYNILLCWYPQVCIKICLSAGI